MTTNRTPRSIYTLLQGLFLRLYYRLVALNYQRELLATNQQTVGGTVKSFELYNRHGNDAMLQDIERHCSADSTIIDIGANVGIYALALAAGQPNRRILAIEPVPEVYAQLAKNVHLNGFSDRIAMLPCCVGEKSGDTHFFVSTFSELSGRSEESASRWGAKVSRQVTVAMKRLDTIVKESSPPDIVKIDVEGSAADVLQGGTETLERHQPIVFLELHTEELTADEPAVCQQLLESAGYSITDRGDYWVARASPT